MSHKTLSPADEYVRQLAHIRERLRAYPEGHTGLQLCAMFRMADLIRLGRFEDIKRIVNWPEAQPALEIEP